MDTTPFLIGDILCPTDFSVFSSRALRHAVALARQFEARLEVVHVIANSRPYTGGAPYFGVPVVATATLREHAEAEMRRFVAPAALARVPVKTEVREGEPWREVLAVAEELPADLVVMGTHGSSGLERLFLGSVAEKLLWRLPCPVLTVCHEEGRTWEAPGLVRRILCATDLRESSSDTVAFALSLAAKNGAEMMLLHVVEGFPETGEHLYLAVPEIGPLRQELERIARERLHQAVPPDAARFGVKIEERVTTGRAYEEILRIASEKRADLVVVGPPAHGAIGRLLLGSTSHHVVREATCPVLTVRPLATTPTARGEGGMAVAMKQKG